MKVIFLTLLCVLAFEATALAQSALQQAVSLYRSGNYEGAAAQLEAMGADGVSSRQAETYLGAAYVHLSKDDKARAAFEITERMRIQEKFEDYSSKLDIKTKPRPDFREVSKKYNEGTVGVAVEFKADGTIGFVFQISATDDEMYPIAKKAAEAIAFKPAEVNGTPVTVVSFIYYEFRNL